MFEDNERVERITAPVAHPFVALVLDTWAGGWRPMLVSGTSMTGVAL
jgi:hypothetical protein